MWFYSLQTIYGYGTIHKIKVCYKKQNKGIFKRTIRGFGIKLG